MEKKIPKKIIIITGNELRHIFFRKFLSSFDTLIVLATYCEAENIPLIETISNDADVTLRNKHLTLRAQTEKDFFEPFCDRIIDNSNPVFIKKNEINSDTMVAVICNLNPDLIISYGCSIIKEPLIAAFKNKFINIHLGLSPYYRGSGTNYWPFVNNEIQYVGVTFMLIDAGIDTGEIIHQIHPRVYHGDNVHTIGNRLIYDMAKMTIQIIVNFELLDKMDQIKIHQQEEKYYRKKDFNEASLVTLYANFSNGLITNYLRNLQQSGKQAKIIENPLLTINQYPQ